MGYVETNPMKWDQSLDTSDIESLLRVNLRIGSFIRKARLAHDLNASDLARIMLISVEAVSYCERGADTIPAAAFARFADHFDDALYIEFQVILNTIQAEAKALRRNYKMSNYTLRFLRSA